MREINIVLSCFFLWNFSFCSGQDATTGSNSSAQKSKIYMLEKEIILIKAIPGGSRAHIITVAPNGLLSYVVGSIPEVNKYDSATVVVDENYPKIRVQLSQAEIADLGGLVKDEGSLEFVDTSVVKDNLQYHLFLNSQKKAFGYEANFNEYPSALQAVIIQLLNYTGKLYKIAGMA